MIKEAYCSYEISKLLKEKGFDERTVYHYIIGQPTSLQHNIVYNKYCNSDAENIYVSPTHQMACAWLREKGIFFCIHPDYPVSKNYIVEFYDDGVPSGLFGAYEKYDDAVEEALKYTLENLI